MYELQQKRLTQGFIKDFDAYISSKAFGIDFISTKLPQMRTIPVNRSLDIQHPVATYDEITALVQQAQGPFVILECICRKKKSIQGKPCKVTDRKETCLGVGDTAEILIENGAGTEISREAALLILEANQREGLVLQPTNAQAIDFICSCCGCCCGMLRTLKVLPKPLDYWAANYFAVVETAACEGCGICETKCQVKAVQVLPKHNAAVIDLDRCIGCGVCVANCPAGALSLSRKAQEIIPPRTREELLDVIMKNKKGRFALL
jgi:ferredoxin